MATIPGGVIDTSTNIDQINKDIISNILTMNNLTETGFSAVTTGNSNVLLQQFISTVTVPGGSGGSVILDGNISSNLAVVLPGSSQTVTVAGGNSNQFVVLSSGSQTVIGGAGNDSVIGGGSSTLLNFYSKAGGTSLTDGGDTISDDQALYLESVALDNNADPVTLASIQKAIQLLSDNGSGTPDDLVVGFARFTLAPNTTQEMSVDASGLSKDTLFAARLLDMTNGSTLVLAGMEKVILVGSGKVRVSDDNPTMLVGDTTAQNITGGAGADTLVGGGGNDTLTGGAGADEFGFIAKGHYTITDFDVDADKLAFDVSGVDSLQDLKAYVTGVSEAGGNTTVAFGANASITLVGVSASELTADLVKFTIG